MAPRPPYQPAEVDAHWRDSLATLKTSARCRWYALAASPAMLASRREEKHVSAVARSCTQGVHSPPRTGSRHDGEIRHAACGATQHADQCPACASVDQFVDGWAAPALRGRGRELLQRQSHARVGSLHRFELDGLPERRRSLPREELCEATIPAAASAAPTENEEGPRGMHMPVLCAPPWPAASIDPAGKVLQLEVQ